MDPSSNTDTSNERLIADLAKDLAPVPPLKPPAVRALKWLAVVAAAAIALAMIADLSAIEHRLSAAPDMWLATAGSTLTAMLAAVAAFKLSLPDARRSWALLPLPATLLWIIASGLGCMRGSLVPETHVASLSEACDCFVFILGLAVPLSIILITMLRRAYSLQPTLTALMAGLASAAAAATLLNFFHPFDAGLIDLVVHSVAVAIIIAANWALSRRLLGPIFLQGRVTGGAARTN